MIIGIPITIPISQKIIFPIVSTIYLISSRGRVRDVNSHGEILDDILSNGIRDWKNRVISDYVIKELGKRIGANSATFSFDFFFFLSIDH